MPASQSPRFSELPQDLLQQVAALLGDQDRCGGRLGSPRAAGGLACGPKLPPPPLLPLPPLLEPPSAACSCHDTACCHCWLLRVCYPAPPPFAGWPCWTCAAGGRRPSRRCRRCGPWPCWLCRRLSWMSWSCGRAIRGGRSPTPPTIMCLMQSMLTKKRQWSWRSRQHSSAHAAGACGSRVTSKPRWANALVMEA